MKVWVGGVCMCSSGHFRKIWFSPTTWVLGIEPEQARLCTKPIYLMNQLTFNSCPGLGGDALFSDSVESRNALLERAMLERRGKGLRPELLPERCRARAGQQDSLGRPLPALWASVAVLWVSPEVTGLSWELASCSDSGKVGHPALVGRRPTKKLPREVRGSS